MRGRRYSESPGVIAGAVLLAAVVLVAAVAIGAESLDRPFGFFSREPSEVLDSPWYTGLLFHIGVLIWFGSAAVTLFAGALVAVRDGRAAAAPLLFAGLFGAVLAVDDALRIHEDLLLDHGIPKSATYAVYAVAFGAWLYAFRDFVARTQWWLLVSAGALLGTSTILDRIFESNQQHLFEDGVKFLGIVAWAMYFIATSFDSAVGRAAPRRTPTAPSAAASR